MCCGARSSIFDEEVSKSFSLDLRDLSRDNWSLLPQAGDFLAEVRTRRFDTLTYARSTGEPEDVTLFHRVRKRNIAAYASRDEVEQPRPLLQRRRPRRIRRRSTTTIDATFSPEREWLDATRAAAAPRQVVRAGGAHAAPGRRFHRAVDRQRRSRPADVPARPQSEQRRRQPAGAVGARRGADV